MTAACAWQHRSRNGRIAPPLLLLLPASAARLTVLCACQLRQRHPFVRQYMVDVPEPLHQLIVPHMHLGEAHGMQARCMSRAQAAP